MWLDEWVQFPAAIWAFLLFFSLALLLDSTGWMDGYPFLDGCAVLPATDSDSRHRPCEGCALREPGTRDAGFWHRLAAPSHGSRNAPGGVYVVPGDLSAGGSLC